MNNNGPAAWVGPLLCIRAWKGGDSVEFFFLISLPIAGGLLYANLVSQMKKIRDRQDTINNTGWGIVLTVYLIFGIIFLIMTSVPR